MTYSYRRSPTFDRKFKKITEKDRGLKDRLVNKISQILDNPEIGDFKRYDLKGIQGVHVNPFVILYRVSGDTIDFVNIDHHDKVYRKLKKSNSAPRSKLRSMFAPFVISRNPVGSSAYSLLSLQGFPGSQRNCGLCPP